MSLSTLKTFHSRIPPAIAVDGSNPKASKVKMINILTLPPLQVKVKESPVLQESFTQCRRQMIQSLTVASSIGLLSLVLPAPTEAHPRNDTMRQKIMEKFEELKGKAGLSDRGGEKPKLKGMVEENKQQMERYPFSKCLKW